MTNRREFVAFTRLVRCFSLFLCFAILGGIQQLTAQAPQSTTSGTDATAQAGATPPRMRGTTMAQRKAAAAHAAQRRAASPQTYSRRAMAKGVHTDAIAGQPGSTPGVVSMVPADLYFSGTYPNYANSPLPTPSSPGCTGANVCGIRKFMDALPLPSYPLASGAPATPAAMNGLNQYMPIAVADTTTFPGSDYYEISLVQWQEQMHTDLPNKTWIRGYVQTNGPAKTNMPPHYLGPLIIAKSGVPVRIKFTNKLPTGTSTTAPIGPTNGNLFIPTDTTAMGSGVGLAKGLSAYLQSRATIHLHGGNTPWISDGTPHQWTVPAGNFTDGSTLYPRGDSVQFVPDMFFNSTTGAVIPQCSVTNATNCTGGTPAQLPTAGTYGNDPGNGSLVFYYTNQQSARLLFYHDHAYGTTRLNVYAGEAAGYLITDNVENDLVTGVDTTGVFANAGIAATKVIPATNIPLVIQDKTFVPPNPPSTSVYSVPILENGSGYITAPTVVFAGGCSTLPTATATVGLMTNFIGQFIYGAVTGITITNPGAGCTSNPVVTLTGGGGSGAAAYASLATLSQQDPTWDTALWGGTGNLWYPHVYMPNQFPDNPDGSAVNPMGRWDYASWFWPVFTSQYQVRGEISCGTSLLMPTSYNTSLWACPGTPSALSAAPIVDLAGSTALGQNPVGQGSTASITPEAFMDTPVVNGTVYPVLTVDAQPTRFQILSVGNDRTLNLSWFLACNTATPQYVATLVNYGCPVAMAGSGVSPYTEVGMVPAAPGLVGYPIWWPTDGRDGGVPDPKAAGPDWVQIGTEGGILPAPVVLPAAPINYEYNRRSVTVTNTSSHSLDLMPAERADVIVDFSGFAGKTLILYNDAPAPYPAFDSRYDYYTGDPDQTGMGGAPTTLAGFGPNTRTIMQVIVRAAGSGTATPGFTLANLQKVIPAAFKMTQPIPIVPQAVYSSIYNPTPGSATTVGSTGPAYKDHLPHLADTQMTFSPIGATVATTTTTVGGVITTTTGLPTVTLPMRNKTIQELFELNFGRMNATLGTELALTNFNTQTTIPLAYVDPFTEDIYDTVHGPVVAGSANPNPIATQLVGALGDGSQIWEVIHNGVDSHAIHFHLYNVQVLDRVGWDGTVRTPDANEYGWKDTVRMNPLEIDFVAIRPMSMDLPFPVPDSTRLLDVTRPAGVLDPDMSAFDPLNNAAPQTNQVVTMGWEYVWHCHILGHEENDMMREQTFQVPPQPPVNLTVFAAITGNTLTFTDMSLSETGFNVERADDGLFTTNLVTLPDMAAVAGWKGSTTWTDTSAVAGNVYYYRVRSFKPDADYWIPLIGEPTLGIPAGPMPNLTSAWISGHTAAVPAATLNMTALAFGNQLITTTSASQSFTLSSTGIANLSVSSISITGISASYFAQTNTCGTTVVTGTSCTITVTFRPLTIGAATASVAVATNDPTNPILYVALTGTGQALVTISASSATVPYGSAKPIITPTVTGLKGTDTVAVLGTITCSTLYTPTSNYNGVTGYQTSCTGAANPNYTFNYVVGKVTITRLAATIYVTPATRVVGVANPPFNGTLTGFLPGVTATFSSTATTASVPSNYPITYTLAPAGVEVNYIIGYNSPSLTVTSAAVTPIMSPASGFTFTGTTQTFTWTPASSATSYSLWVGTTGVGSSNLLNLQTSGLSLAVSGLPLAGGPVYVRLYWLVGATWLSADYTYVAFSSPAHIITPIPGLGTTLPAGTGTFTWSTAPGASQYALWIGTTGVGSSNLFNQVTAGTSLTVNVLPVSGGTVYVRLSWLVSGTTWLSADYVYTGFNSVTAMVSPTPGLATILPAGTATFTWSAAPSATQYALWVGTTAVGSSNLFNQVTAGTSLTVNSLPLTGAGTVYVRLNWFVGGVWKSLDYVYTAF